METIFFRAETMSSLPEKLVSAKARGLISVTNRLPQQIAGAEVAQTSQIIILLLGVPTSQVTAMIQHVYQALTTNLLSPRAL